MPIYSYKCKACGQVFDRLEKKIGGNSRVGCDYCSGEAIRIYMPVGIIFKGSGFYTTDYKSNTSKSTSTEKTEIKNKKDNEKSKSIKSNVKNDSSSNKKEGIKKT